jgi:hypothetical protein
MEVNSSGEIFSVEDGLVQIAFDLRGSEPEYLIISAPEGDGGAAGEFFGHDHYVELKDQLFGRYGGLTSINLPREDCLEIRLSIEVPNVGAALTINTKTPMSDAILSQLRKLQPS